MLILILLCSVSLAFGDLHQLVKREVSRPSTVVTTSQCSLANECTCSVAAPEPCSIDLQYQEIVAARRQLDQLYEHLDGEMVEQIKVTLTGLVGRVGILENSLHNQSISLSITELQGLQEQIITVQQTLKEIVESRNTTVTQQLIAEVELIQKAMLKLATRNPIAVREDMELEISKLKARLASCSTAASTHHEKLIKFIGDGLPANHLISAEVCAATTNISIGEPLTFKFQDGRANTMWLKDPLPPSDVEKTRIFEVADTANINQKLVFWNNLDDFEDKDYYSRASVIACNMHVYGKKFQVLNGSMYWMDQYQGVNVIRKFDAYRDPTCAKTAIYSSHKFAYTGYDYTLPFFNLNDADLNYDETGLYVVYASSNSDIVISKLNPETLAFEKTWDTGKRKQSVSLSFMVCGRLYTADDYSSRKLTGKQWGFDTKTETEFFHDLNIEFKYGAMSALSYNPREKALFGWDNQHAVYYPVYF